MDAVVDGSVSGRHWIGASGLISQAKCLVYSDQASIMTHGFEMPSKVSSSEAHGVGSYLSHVRSSHMRNYQYQNG
ncbi:hypothetical protein F0562_023716 [Nyssa sinensis]|uniref:Uncharacterized protein n=1 Tax=Nyssa sinensis TaxID=561372 RepID=A0A5J5BIL9_9ASTE|nr:hypothetical protein F0562_023716 [Nyssa sinensis]